MISESVPTEGNTLRVQLQELLRQALRSQVELVDFKIGNRHHDYLVLLVELRQPSIKVVVKLAGRDAPIACPFDRTARLHRLVAAETNIPMPEVLAVDVSYQTVPWRYLIKRHITLQHLSNERDISFGTNACRTSFSLPWNKGQICSQMFTGRVCHEDLHGHNILFRLEEGQWRLATILDFDKAWAGHNESDLARLELWKGRLGKEFWWAYEKIHRMEPLYRQRRPIYQLLWCLEYARPTAEHLADTRRVCAELGLASIGGVKE